MDYAGDLTLEMSVRDEIFAKKVRRDGLEITIKCYKSNNVLLFLPLGRAKRLLKELGQALEQEGYTRKT